MSKQEAGHATNTRLVSHAEARANIEREKEEDTWPQFSIRHVSASSFRNIGSDGKSAYVEYARRKIERELESGELVLEESATKEEPHSVNPGSYPIMCRIFTLKESMLSPEEKAEVDRFVAKFPDTRREIWVKEVMATFVKKIAKDMGLLGVMVKPIERGNDHILLALPYSILGGGGGKEQLVRDVEGEVMMVAYLLRRGLVTQEDVDRTIGASTSAAASSRKIQAALDAAGIEGPENSEVRAL